MKADSGLVQHLASMPDAEFQVLVRVADRAALYQTAVSEHGLTVERVFRLTRTIAARGSGERVLELLGESWVERVELDREVKAMT